MSASKVKCAIAIAIAIDSGNEALGEIILGLLPSEWQPHATFSAYAQWNDVIEMVRNTLPALLVINTNLLMLSPDGIDRCVAVSPNTRYLFITAWSEEGIETLLTSYETFPVSVLRLHFDRAQLIAAVEGAFGSLT